MKREIFILSCLFFIISNFSYSQEFRSIGSGNWSSLSTWEMSVNGGTTWIPAYVAPSSASGSVTIQSGHTVTVDASTNTDETTVNAGGTVVVPAGITLIVANGTPAIDMQLNGTLRSSGTVTTTGNLTFGATGIYEHNQDGGVVPFSTWTTGSTCMIIGSTGTSPTGLGQFFSNFTWNCTSQGAAHAQMSAAMTNIGGNFSILSTGTTGSLRYNANSPAAATFNIGGSLIISGGTFNLSSGTSIQTINISNNLNISGGTLTKSGGATSVSLNIGGNFNMSGGTLTNAGGSAGTPSNMYLNFGSSSATQTISQSAGTILGSANSPINWQINTTASGKAQLVSNFNLGSTSGNFIVNPNATFDFQNYQLTGSFASGKAFVTYANTTGTSATLITSHASGINTSGATGSIATTGTRTFNAPCLVYNGSAAQVTGNVIANIRSLTINNVAGVTLSANCSMDASGILTLTAGKLIVNSGGQLLLNNTSPAAVASSSATSYVVTDLSTSFSSLQRAIPSIGLPATFFFPVGTSDAYSPVSYTFSANSAPMIIRMMVDPTSPPSLTGMTSYVANRYWYTDLMSGSENTYTYTAQYNFLNGDVVGTIGNIRLGYLTTGWQLDAGSSVAGSTIQSGSLNQTSGNLNGNYWAGVSNFNFCSAFPGSLLNDTSNYIVCSGSSIDFSLDSDGIAPININDPNIQYNPGISWALYSDIPTVLQGEIISDISYKGIIPNSQGPFSIGVNLSLSNDSSTVSYLTNALNLPSQLEAPFSFFIAPITMYDYTSEIVSVSSEGGYCGSVGEIVQITFVPPIQVASLPTSCTFGNAPYSILQGTNSSNPITFTLSNLSPVDAYFTDNSAANGGIAQVNNLSDGDYFSFTISDPNGCKEDIYGGPFYGLHYSTINLVDSICEGGTPVALSASSTNGVWYGEGVTNNIFYPKSVGPGVWNVFFTLNEPCGGTSTAQINVIGGKDPISNFIVQSYNEQIIKICPGELIVVDGSQSQFIDSSSYESHKWNWGDGSFDDNINSWPIGSHSFNDPGIYKINLEITDNFACTNIVNSEILVLVSPPPTVTIQTNLQDSILCRDFTLVLSSTFNSQTIQNEPPSFFNNNGSFNYLADDQSNCYSDTINVSGFDEGTIIDSISDILSFFINIEHSFLNDLSISFTCPNGSNIVTHSNGGGGEFLGEPIDVDDSIQPGLGYNYYWSPSSTNGTWQENAESNSGNTLDSGNYESVQPFENLIGCPLNGHWILEICDGWSADDGFIFDWSINFNQHLFDSTEYSPHIGIGCDSSYWDYDLFDSELLTSQLCDTIELTFATSGFKTIYYNLINDFGCNYTDSVKIQVMDPPIYYDCYGTCIHDTDGDGVCDEAEIVGCTDLTACNFDSSATQSDGSCIYPITPSVFITSSDTDNNVCPGTSVTFTATPTNGGTTPSYQWKLNGANVGTNSTTYTNASLTNGAIVTVVMTANNACQTSSTANGNSITTTVNNSVTPAVTITSSDADNSICSGTSVTFTATPTNGGTTPSYNWKLNGANVGTNSTTYTNASLTNGAIVTVVMTANNACQTSSTANGNSITTTVNNSLAPAVTITSSDADNSICSGTSVTFTATPTNGGTTPSYQWKLNGNNVGTNATTYTSTILANNDQVTVVMTANNACQTSSTSTGSNITMVITNPVIWYLDVDGDGYYVTSQISCTSPGLGYTSLISLVGDCNDNNSGISPGSQEICSNQIDDNCNGQVDENCAIYGCITPNACNYNPIANTDDGSCILPQPEVCNNLDDNCNNQIDEGLTYVNYYADNDADSQGAGAAVNACAAPGNNYVTTSGDCNDNDNTVNASATEICDAVDNDCDGLINEGLQLSNISFSTVNTALYPTCSTSNLFAANLNTGANSEIISGDGPDLWYKLTAQYNTLRVGLSAATGNNSVGIYQVMSNCLMLISNENEITTGNQTLLTDGLTVGNTYYIAIHQLSAPSSSSAKVCFNHLVPSTCDHVYSNNTGVYTNVCSSFKAQFKGNATNYIFNVLSATQNGSNLNITPWSYTTPTSSSIITRLGTLLPANMSASSRVYTINVPVTYGLYDAANNLNLITANATSTCTVTLQPESGVVLRTTDRCPSIKGITQSIATDRSICGTSRYEWEFTQVLPTAQSPITVLGGLNTNVLFLNTVPGMANGKTYNVRVRPIHSTGEVGAYGASHCMKTTGAGMVMEDHPGSAEPNHPSFLSQARVGGEMVSLFPNPTVDGQVTLMWKEVQEGKKEMTLRDVQGRVVWKEQVVIEGNVIALDWKHIDTGIYLLELDGVVLRVVKG